jgi:hypothetical protein
MLGKNREKFSILQGQNAGNPMATPSIALTPEIVGWT